MKLTSTSFADGQKIPGELAFCVPDAAHHVCLGKNLNPQLAWSDVPAGTRSFAVICHDPDVPSQGDDVNQEGRVVPAALPRVKKVKPYTWSDETREQPIDLLVRMGSWLGATNGGVR